MSSKKLSVTQKQTIFQIIDNNLDPKEKIEEILAKKNKLLIDIKMKSENLDNLQKKKAAFDEIFVKYKTIIESRKSEYDDLLLEIEILGEELAKLVENQEIESIKSKIEKEIQEILELENNRDEYSDRFLEIRKSAINSIKEALIKKDTQDSVQDEVNNDIKMMKTIGIEIGDEEKNNMVQEAINKAKPKAFEEIKPKEEDKEKVRYLKDLEELVNKKVKRKEKSQDSQELPKEGDSKKKTMDIYIDMRGPKPSINILPGGTDNPLPKDVQIKTIDFEKTKIPENHIDNILSEGAYKNLELLGITLGSQIDDIRKIYRLADKGFNIKKLDDELKFVMDFLRSASDDSVADLFANLDGKKLTVGRTSVKDVSNLAKKLLQPTIKIKPILEISESMNIHNRFKNIINKEDIDSLKKLINQYKEIVQRIFDDISKAKNNEECIDIVNINIEEYSKIYDSLASILLRRKTDRGGNVVGKSIEKLCDYLGIRYMVGFHTNAQKESDNKTFIAEQILFTQLIQYNTKDVFIKDIDKLKNLSQYIVWQAEILAESKLTDNVKGFFRNIYNTILVIIDIFINKAVIYKKAQNIVKNNDIIEEDNEENTDKYKSLADKYFSLLPDINSIGDDNIIINNKADDKDNEMINPMVIKSEKEGQDDQLIISIGNLEQLIEREKKRQRIQEEYKLDTKVAEDKIRKTTYTGLNIDRFNFKIPNELDGIGSIFVHENGEVSIDGMTEFGLLEALGDLNYERFRAWVFYYLYEANCKIDKRGMGNPYEELGLSKPPSSDDLIIQHDPRYVYDANIQNSGVQRIVKYKRGFVRLLRVGRTTGENAIENVNKLNSEGAEIRLFAWFFSKGCDPMIDEPIKKIEITDKSKLEILEIQNKTNTGGDEFVCFDTWVSEHKKDENLAAPVRVKVGKMIGAGDGFVKKLNEMKYTENKEKPKTEKIQKDLKDKEKNDVPAEVNELSKKILAFFKTRELKIQGKEKAFKKDLIRIANSAFGAREFDFARYENTYEIDEEKDLIRKNIKKRAKEKGRTNQQ